MIDQFAKLPASDQKKIIKVCIEEFGDKGYLRASTNTIVKNAGIPKGTLFYFFGNKKKLFLYLIDHAVNQYIGFIESYIKSLPTDLFDRMLYMVEVRMRFAAHAPYLYQFFFRTLLNVPEEIKTDMQDRFKFYTAANRDLMTKGLDISRLKKGVSVDQVMELLGYFMGGLLASHTENLTKLDADQSLDYVEKLLEQGTIYFEMIKQGVYSN
jgi:AcrR family transcriptional regulator